MSDQHFCSFQALVVSQAFMVLLLVVLHDALLLYGGFSLATRLFTLNPGGGLIVENKRLQLLPNGGVAAVGSGELTEYPKGQLLHSRMSSCSIQQPVLLTVCMVCKTVFDWHL